MKQINLYQSEFRPPKVVLPARALALSGGVFLLGLFALYAWDGWQLRQLQVQVDQAVQRADAVTRQVQAGALGVRAADPAVAAEAQALEARVRALQRAQDAIASGELGAETGYSAQFRALARTGAAGAWLTGVTISDRGRAMDLQGRALTGADSARLISNLRREPLFVGLSFAGLEVGAPEVDAATAEEAASARAQAPHFLAFSLSARLAEPAASGPAVAGQPGSTR